MHNFQKKCLVNTNYHSYKHLYCFWTLMTHMMYASHLRMVHNMHQFSTVYCAGINFIIYVQQFSFTISFVQSKSGYLNLLFSLVLLFSLFSVSSTFIKSFIASSFEALQYSYCMLEFFNLPFFSNDNSLSFIKF